MSKQETVQSLQSLNDLAQDELHVMEALRLCRMALWQRERARQARVRAVAAAEDAEAEHNVCADTLAKAVSAFMQGGAV